MNFKKIKKIVFIGMVVSCLASFSFANNSEVTQNNKDVYCSPYYKGRTCPVWEGSPYSDFNVFARAFIEKTDNKKLNFEDIPQSDDMTQKEIKGLNKQASGWYESLGKSSIGKKILNPDGENLEQEFNSIYEELNKLDNTGELGKLFEKLFEPKRNLFFAELVSVLKRNILTDDQIILTDDQVTLTDDQVTLTDDQVTLTDDQKRLRDEINKYDKIIFDELHSPNISNDSLDKINAILGKLSNSSNLVSLFTDYFTNEFKPYLAEHRFDNYVSGVLRIYSENYIKNNASIPITEYDTFFISDVIRRPHSKRAEEILDKLDPSGKLKNLYRGLFS